MSEGTGHKKLRDYLGVFPKWRTPRPPIWEASVQKKNCYDLFCILSPKEHFWFLQMCSLFVSINRSRPKIQLPLSDQIDQIFPPPYCKTCFSTSE